jgi:branched-chain amino acid transport system ATP-binding protein
LTLLDVQAVSKSFAGLRALHDVSLTVEAGSLVGLIGPNGAGKTTLFNVISGAFPPDEGRVLLNGEDVTGWPMHRIAQQGVGRTFQIMKPFAALSVLDNVTVATFQRHRSKAQARSAAEKVIERIGLEDWAERPASVLSTAGRKRLELARVLALEPSLLLLDEVVAGLVPSEREKLMDLLEEIREETGVAMLLVEHVMAAVMRLSHRIFVLHHGEVLASGTPQEITKNPQVIDAYLGEEHADADS